MNSHTLAATLGMTPRELSEYRYHPGRISPAVYAIGDHYYACAVSEPKSAVGTEWRKHNDQFWAGKAGKTVWICDVKESNEDDK